MSIFGQYQTRFEDTQQEEYSLEEYLEICKSDPSAYATAAERLLLAIGEPETGVLEVGEVGLQELAELLVPGARQQA